MNWSPWKQHFEAQQHRPLPPVEALGLTDEQRGVLGRSLARFQLGEAGEGRIASDIDRANLPGVDSQYRAALKLFVREEARHGKVLGLMVHGLGERVLEKQWSEWLFVRVRRMFGIRFKLLVLLAAEVIAIGFYGQLARVLKGPIAKAFEQICADEEQHLLFHAAFFRAQMASPIAWLVLRALWWPLALAATTVVLFDHRRLMPAFGLSAFDVWNVFITRIRTAARGMRDQAPMTKFDSEVIAPAKA